MKILIISFFLALNFHLFCQANHVINIWQPVNLTNGPYDIGTYFDDVNFYGKIKNSAQVDIKPEHEILFGDGAEITNFSNSGYLYARIEPKQIDIASFSTNSSNGDPWSVFKYDKFELGLTLPSNITSQIQDYLNGNNGLNPYDPNQIKIQCDFTNSGNTYTRYGFYYRDFTTQNNKWIEQSTDYIYRVRFAPPEVGSWGINIKVYVNGVLLETAYRYFNVFNSQNPGHLKMANGNLLKLQHENGKMFFGVGQNIPFAMGLNNNPCIDMTYGSCACHDAYERQRSWINDLANNGGNFTRIRIDAESNPVEWGYVPLLTTDPPKNPNESLLKYLNNYDINQRYMWELDKTFNTLESRKVYAILCILEDQNYSILNAYSNNQNYLWANSPYSALLGNNLGGCKNFFSDPSAKDYFKKQLFYIMARWGYSTSLAMWEMINETVNVANSLYQSNNHEIDNDASFNTDVKNWICDMKYYLETLGQSQASYPWHPTTTGFVSSNNAKNIAYDCLNVWSSNSYVTYIDSASGKYRDEDFDSRANALLGANNANIAGYFPNYKPFFWGELGIADGANVIDKRSDRPFHNTIWASTFTGGISNGLYWNDFEQSLGTNHRSNFIALKAFTDMIDFTQRLEPFKSKDFGANGLNNREIHTWWMRNTAKNYVVGWTKNNSANWTQDLQYFPYSDQQIVLNKTYFNNNVDEYTCFSTNQNPETSITGLLGSTKYKIKIYNTYNNANEIEVKTATSNGSGKLTFRRTMYSYVNDPFNADYAFIIRPKSSWRMANNNVLTINDTIYATTLDTLNISSNFVASNSKYEINWDITDEQHAHDSILSINYPNEGTYSVNLEATSAENDTIINHNFIIIISDKVIEKELDKISLYPIPANNFVYLYYNNEIIKNPKITCVDMLGREQEFSQVDLFKFNTSNLLDGIYIIKFKYSNNEKIFKINITH